MKYIVGLMISVLLMSSNAFATSTGWFTIHELYTGDNSGSPLIVALSYDLNLSGSCSNGHEIVMLSTDVHYEEFKKILMGAFLAGKQVRGTFSSCSNKVNVPTVRLCRRRDLRPIVLTPRPLWTSFAAMARRASTLSGQISGEGAVAMRTNKGHSL